MRRVTHWLTVDVAPYFVRDDAGAHWFCRERAAYHLGVKIDDFERGRVRMVGSNNPPTDCSHWKLKNHFDMDYVSYTLGNWWYGAYLDGCRYAWLEWEGVK